MFGGNFRMNRALVVLSAVSLMSGLGSAARSQDVEHKPGWEQEEAAVRKSGKKGDAKPGLLGKDELSKLMQMMTDRLKLNDAQQQKINAVLQAHAAEMSGAQNSKKTEESDQYKDLKDQFKKARESEDFVARHKIESQLSSMRHDQMAAKSAATPDYDALMDDIEKELTQAQIPEFRKLAEEVGIAGNADAGSKLKPKDYLHIITGKTVSLKPEQVRKIEFIYRDTQEQAKEVASDHQKLVDLITKMRADMRDVLDANQRRLVAQLLSKAEERQQKESSSKSASADSSDDSSDKTGGAAVKSGDDTKSLVPEPMNQKRDKQTLGKRRGKTQANSKKSSGESSSPDEDQ